MSNEYLIEVFISLKEVVNDPQGLAVRDGLHNLGFGDVKGVRVGKYLQISVQAGSAEQAKTLTSEMCEKLLANTVIEEYRITVADRAAS